MTLTSEYRHIPVMLDEVLDTLSLHDGSVVVDCTLGGAGHSLRLAERIAPSGVLIGIDQDDAALAVASERLASVPLDVAPILLKGNFGDIDRLLVTTGVAQVDAFLFDLGVSSPQLDFPERGFSYQEDAPLDMRMDPGTQTLTAAEVIATYSQSDLARVIRSFGEEKWASRIASFLVSARESDPVETTARLVEVVKAAVPAAARREGGHPAKRTFQALRIEVNRELEVLQQGLEAAIRWTGPGGRIAVISYHSLEDRIVKQMFAEKARTCVCPPDLPVCACGIAPTLKVVTRKALVPGAEELERNPRSRSAKLRVAEKI